MPHNIQPSLDFQSAEPVGHSIPSPLMIYLRVTSLGISADLSELNSTALSSCLYQSTQQTAVSFLPLTLPSPTVFSGLQDRRDHILVILRYIVVEPNVWDA